MTAYGVHDAPRIKASDKVATARKGEANVEWLYCEKITTNDNFVISIKRFHMVWYNFQDIRFSDIITSSAQGLSFLMGIVPGNK